MSRIYLTFQGSMVDFCKKLEKCLGRDYLVDITEEKRSVDVAIPGPGRDWYSPNYKSIKHIIVRHRGMRVNTQLAIVILIYGRVIYDDDGPVYEDQKTVIKAIKEICK